MDTMTPPIRVQMLGGYIEITSESQNEVSIISTIDDPPAIRFASPGGGLGKFSGNVIDANGRQEEVVLMQFKNAERDRGTSDEFKGGAMTLHLKNPHVSDDAGMVKIFEADYAGITFCVPVTQGVDGGGTFTGGGTPIPGSSRVSRFYSDNGRYCYNVQGDSTEACPHGRIVQYDTHGSIDEATWTAVATMQGTPI
tara:strand:+ start:5838 stop:6425 length:588 start_codon:yes stop_codon:yes gene_type:complete